MKYIITCSFCCMQLASSYISSFNQRWAKSSFVDDFKSKSNHLNKGDLKSK